MKLKRNLGVLVSIIAITSLIFAGCGKSASSVTESNKDNTDTTKTEVSDVEAAKKIVVFQSKVEIIDQLEALAVEYKAETGVEVEVWGTTGDDYLQQLKTKLSNNQGPTVFSLAPGTESNGLAPYLANLNDVSFVGDIAENMANVIDGNTVGIPYTVEGFGIVYNKDLIDVTKVNTYDAFVSMLQEQKDAGINGFSLSQESYFLIGHILNTPFALQEDAESYVNKLMNGEVTMNDTEEFVEFGKFMEAVREYTNNPLEVNYDKQTGDFATGKTASIHQGNWCYSMFKDYNVDFDMGMMPLPIAGNDSIAVSVPTCWYVNSQAKEAEIKAGKDFLEWMYTTEKGKKYIMEEFGFIPVLTTMKSETLDPLSQEIARYTAEGKTISWPMNAYWPAGIVDVYLVPVAQKFFTTDMTGEEFLAELTDAFVQAGK